MTWMQVWFRDFRQGMRSVRRSPWHAALAAVTLGLGISLVTVQYTPVHRLILQPLPLDTTGTMVSLRWSGPTPHSRAAWLRHQELSSLARLQRSFSTLTGYSTDAVGHSVRWVDGRWIQKVGMAVLPGFLATVGIQVRIGRGLLPEDHRLGAEPVLVISHALWEDLGRDPGILGKTIYFDRQNRTIVGVARPHPGVEGETFWAPLTEPSPSTAREMMAPLHVLAIPKPEVSVADAQQDVRRLAANTSDLPIELFSELGPLEVVPVREGLLRAETLNFYRLMLLVSILVLVCACANVANLLLARAAGRRRELAVRVSLGATRSNLVHMMMGESALIGLAGAILGLVLSLALGDLARLQTEFVPLPPWMSFRLDWSIVATVTCVSLLGIILFALIPGIRTSQLDIQSVLKDDAPTSSGPTAGRTASTLIAAQVTVSAAVLLVAFCVGLTWSQRARRPFHVDPERFVSAGVVFPRDEFRDESRVHAVIRDLDRRLRDLPAGMKGGLSTRAGLSQGRETRIWTDAGAAGPGERVFHASVGLSFFGAMEAPVLEGRPFNDGDDQDSAGVAIVDSGFVQRFWPGASALGRAFTVVHAGGEKERLLVVGVVPSLHLGGAVEKISDAPGFFTPLTQMDRRAAVFPFVTGHGSLATFGRTLTAVIRAADPEWPPKPLWTFRERLDRQQSGLRIFVGLFGLFGLAALALSAVGLYGLVSLSVRRRTREIGTRAALGATSGRIMGMFLAKSAQYVAVGLITGTVLGTLLLTLVEARLGPLDGGVAAFASIAAVLGTTGLLATILPAARASRLPPTLALRE